jgi:trimeric autotransporter adhesin
MMKSYNNSKAKGEGQPIPLRLGLVTLLVGTGLALSMPANATPPPANSVIGNQAVADYQDASGAPQTTLSNLVQTTVTEVGAFTLTPDVDKTILAGQTAYMPHILTNNGNAADTFNLSLYNLANTQVPASFKVYVDNNADGMPDDLNTPLCTVTPATGAGVLTTAPATCTTPSVPGAGTALNLVIAVQSSAGNNTTPWETYELAATPTNAVAFGYPTSVLSINGGAAAATTALKVTDTIRIDSNTALFDVTKSINIPGGPASSADCAVDGAGVITGTSCKTAIYTLTYTNRGDAVGDIQLQDIIGQGATVGMKYIPSTTGAGTTKWGDYATTTSILNDNVIGAVPGSAEYTDATGAKIYYEGIATSGTVETLNAFVTGVKPNATGSISFKVLILNTAKVGTSTTTNTAQFAKNVAVTTTPAAPTSNSNPASYIVGLGQVYAVIANDGTAVGAGNAAVPTDGNNVFPATSAADLVTGGKIDNAGGVVTSAAAGQAIFFDNIIWNTGEGTDTFDVQLRPDLVNTFPAGTSFQLFKADGVNPLLDTSGNGIPDTGPILAGQGTGSSYTVKVKAIIPLNACSSTGVCPAGPFTVQKIATSVGDSSKFNSVFDELTTITAGSVDLRNLAAAAGVSGGVTTTVDAGVGTGTIPSTGVIDVINVTSKAAVSPGSTVYFDLPVYNMSSVADSYALSYHVKVAPQLVNVSGFVEGTLPAGWKVTFRKNTAAPGTVCSAANAGTAITSTDLIAATSSQHVCAEVTTPNSATAATYLHFKVQSLASGARDVKIDAIASFASVGTLTLTPDNTGQVYPGGTVVYPHTLAASGTSSCNVVTLGAKMDAALIGLGWSGKVYLDANNDGELQTAGDTLLGAANAAGTPFTVVAGNLVPGAPQRLLVQVFAPNGAAIGVTNLIALKASSTNTAPGVGGCGDVTSTANATDLTTVIIGQVRLYKKQALSTGCDAVLDTIDGTGAFTAVGGGSYSVQQIKSRPGQCILYQVTAINEGAAPVKGLVIRDTTPVFTTSEVTPAGACTGGSNPAIVEPAGTTGAVTCTWPAAEALAPGNQAIMTFRVKIDN